MKLAARQVAGFLARPDPTVGAILLYGPDRGLVRERSAHLLAKFAADPEDPFSVTELAAEAIKGDPALLADAVGALTLTGERRVVRVRGSDPGLAAGLAEILEVLAPGDAVILVEAGELAPRDKLRRLFEGADNGVALPCYMDEGADLEGAITSILGQHGIQAEPMALAFLVENLGSDRLVTRSELEKLALYKGDDKSPVTLAEVEAGIGDGAPFLLDDAVLAAASGQHRNLDRALGRCHQAGQAPVTVLRAVGRHLQRLHLAASLMLRGESAADAMRRLRPPVFFKQQGVFRGQLGQWSPARLAQALEILVEAEIHCKTTGLPAETVARRALMRIAQAARAGAR